MSAAEEAARALAWQATQDEIAAARKLYDTLLIGDPVAAAAFKAKWQDYIDYIQEQRNASHYEAGTERGTRIN